jgi:hypothetical protein
MLASYYDDDCKPAAAVLGEISLISPSSVQHGRHHLVSWEPLWLLAGTFSMSASLRRIFTSQFKWLGLTETIRSSCKSASTTAGSAQTINVKFLQRTFVRKPRGFVILTMMITWL